MDAKATDRRDGPPIRYRDENWERRRHVPKHAARSWKAVKSAAALMSVAALILVGFDAWREYSAHFTLLQAARQGARLDALGQPNGTVVSQVRESAAVTESGATGLTPVTVSVTACLPGAGPTANAIVVVRYQSLRAQGVMPCEI